MSEAKDNQDKWLKQAAIWAEDKWGYMSGRPGYEGRAKIIREMQDDFYIVTYTNQPTKDYPKLIATQPIPIGTFSLTNYTIDNLIAKNLKVKELDYVYVDESFRSNGIGSEIIKKAKSIAEEQNAKMIVLDTLTPSLNRFYNKHNAMDVCDNLIGKPKEFPTTLLRIKI